MERVDPPYEYRGLEVDWNPSEQKIGSLFLPDGEEVEIWSDPKPFGFARWLDEAESE